jgi:hypothetical protein
MKFIKSLFRRLFQSPENVKVSLAQLFRPSPFFAPRLKLIDRLAPMILLLCASASLRLNAQSLPSQPDLMPPLPPTSLTDLTKTAGTGITQAATDGLNVFQKLSLTNPISFGVFGVKNGKNYGAGVDVSSDNPESLVNVGFALLALPNSTSHQLDFYDATLNLSISTVEKIPVLNIPVTLKIESGPAFRLSRGGNMLLEQSAAFGDVTLDWINKWPVTIGGGLIHCSAFSGALPMAHLNVTHTF